MKTSQLIIGLTAAALAAGIVSDISAAPRNKKPPPPPPKGDFQVSEGMNRSWCLIEMREATGKLWPMFWLGNPKGSGNINTETGAGSFTLFGPGNGVQLIAGSRQEKRIGGALMKIEKYKDRQGAEQQRRVGPDIELKVTVTGGSNAKVTILYNGKTVNTTGSVSLTPAKPQGKGGIDINGTCNTTLSDLGLARESTPVTVLFYSPGR